MEESFTSKISNLVKADGVIVERTKVPAYLSLFLGTEEDILLIRKEARKDKVRYCVDPNNESFIPDGDITGVPLEAPFAPSDDSINFTVLECEQPQDNATHAALNLADARSCLSCCNLSIKSDLPIWVFCDGFDARNQRTLLLGSENQDGWFKRSWGVYKGIEKEMPNFNSYGSIHSSISQIPQNSMCCELTCVCQVNKVCGRDTSQSYSSTLLQLSWNKLCLNPPLDASTETVLITKCHIGSGTGGLTFMWNQLCLLQKYLEAIISSGHSDRHGSNNYLPSSSFVLESLDNYNFTESGASLNSKLSKIINEPIRGYKPSVESNPNLAKTIDEFTKPNRPGLDLTDKLWYFFMECSTYQELFTYLRQLLEMNRNKTHSPYLRSSNISRLAMALVGEAGASILDPLEFMVEIGIEKLKYEVLQIFSKGQIATMNSLNLPNLPKFNEVPNSNWVSTVQQWLLWLCRIHCVLELLSNTQTALALGNDSLATFVPGVLKQFLGSDSKIEGIPWLIEKPVQMIKTRISTQLISSHVPNNFMHWTLKLTSESNTRKVRSIFYRGLQFPFPGSLLKDDSNLTLASISGKVGYHCCELHSVADRFFY